MTPALLLLALAAGASPSSAALTPSAPPPSSAASPSTPPTPPPAPPSAPAASPAVAFVVESTVVVHANPDDASAAVVEVPIWTAVRMAQPASSAAATWVRVVVGPRTLRYDAPGGEARPVAPVSFDGGPSGFVRRSALDVNPPSRLGLVALAKDAKDESARRTLLARAYALDPGDDDVKRALVNGSVGSALSPVSRKRHSPFARAELVFGCRGDLARALVVGGALLGRDPVEVDACIAHVDTRAPCGEHGVVDAVGAARKKAAVAHTVARFGNDGPALRLVPAPGASDRPIYVVTRLLAGDGCNAECNAVAAVTDVKLDRLRVPAVPQSAAASTTLHVLVPRYTGALYDVVSADNADAVDVGREPFELGPDFDVDPRSANDDDAESDEPQTPGARFFIAPDVCCACEDEP